MWIVNLRRQHLGQLIAVIAEQLVQPYRMDTAFSQVEINLLLPNRLRVFKIERSKLHDNYQVPEIRS